MKTHINCKYLFFVITFLACTNARATTVEPGSIRIGGGLGPATKFTENLGGSNSFLMLNINSEYSVNRNLSGIIDFELGIANTIPLNLRAGVRYRLTGLDLPISPYGQLQLGAGRLINALGADLSTLAISMAAGVDYFLTSKITVGIISHLNLNTSLGERPANFGIWQLLCTASYAFPY